jgi:nickel/cobalt transporter (NicO) family protein
VSVAAISSRKALGRCATLLALSLLAVAALHGHHALAQARNPFNVGVTEGGGRGSGVVGWIIAEQLAFERLLSGAVRAVRGGAGALWTLIGLSFAYGVFHAAGPGHGKAVVASYMIANEQALKRGLLISLAAAILQGLVAVAIVGGLAAILHATAQVMTRAANLIEIGSFAAVAALGAWLVWRKGRAFVAALRQKPAAAASRFACEAIEDDSGHVHDENCGHFHMPDPKALGDAFRWRDAALTIATAGSRPCSGAILVLVFSLAQGVLYAGMAATAAMSLGTAITTGALAAMAVLFKKVALRFTGETSRRGVLLARGLELLAACAVFILGSALLLGYSLADL